MQIIVKPIITEKVTSVADKLNRYGFVVHENANKIQIKKAIQDLYGVTVEEVNTMRYIGKIKSRNTKNGVNSGLAGRCKKAMVTLKSGDIIDLFTTF
jgi:large subunit ribosomal protein L23